MAKRKVHDVLLLLLILDVHHGVQHVPGVLESVFNRFLLKNYAEMMYHMAKRKVHELLDLLLLVLVRYVSNDVQHVPKVLGSVFNQFILKN